MSARPRTIITDCHFIGMPGLHLGEGGHVHDATVIGGRGWKALWRHARFLVRLRLHYRMKRNPW